MPEKRAEVGDVELCYETFGDRRDPAMLLVMGLATQMLGWREEFCEQLAARGFFVIRYDNRDVGRSTKIRGRPPTTWQLVSRAKEAAHYSLDDMAADGVGLLDALDIDRAHVVGASMGGMIAQTIAARHPDRVLSLVSIMSNTGNRRTGQPAFTVLPVLLKTPPKERDAYIAFTEKLFDTIGSTDLERDVESLREMAGLSFERRQDPRGSGRQLAAIIASGDRTKELESIRCPTLVIHGSADKLVRPSGGKATAKAIPGAEFMLIEGMGHDLPRPAWEQIVDGIERTAGRATDEVPQPA